MSGLMATTVQHSVAAASALVFSSTTRSSASLGRTSSSSSSSGGGSPIAAFFGGVIPLKDCQCSSHVSFDYRPKSCRRQGLVIHCAASRGSYKRVVEDPIRRRALNKRDEQNEPSFDSFAAQARELLLADSSGGDGELNFFERLALAWSILFPPVRRKSSSNADIAKQRLKMILISDRCSVNDDAKRKIVNNIVGALSDFVEIESEDKVQLTVSSDPSLGTVYSVTVPVRRVKPAYQEYSRELQNVALAEEFEDEFRTLDITLEYPNAVDTPQP
ncbi:unnamed protein product [Calypogeia fissa]